jgi:hypothetical protein
VPKPSSEIEKLWTRTSDTADLLQETRFNFIYVASGCRLSLTRAPMSHGGGCILRAPGVPVDLDRYPLAGNSRVDKVKRYVLAGVGEEPYALADHQGIREQDDFVDQVGCRTPGTGSAHMTPLSSSNPDHLTCGVRVLTVFPSPPLRDVRTRGRQGLDPEIETNQDSVGASWLNRAG